MSVRPRATTLRFSKRAARAHGLKSAPMPADLSDEQQRTERHGVGTLRQVARHQIRRAGGGERGQQQQTQRGTGGEQARQRFFVAPAAEILRRSGSVVAHLSQVIGKRVNRRIVRDASLGFVAQAEAELARAGGEIAILAHGERGVEAADFRDHVAAQDQVRSGQMARGTGGETGRQDGAVGGEIFEARRKARLARSAGAAGEIGVAGIENVPEDVRPIGFGNAIVVQEVDDVAACFGQAAITGVPISAPRFWDVARRGSARPLRSVSRSWAVVDHDDLVDLTRLTRQAFERPLQKRRAIQSNDDRAKLVTVYDTSRNIRACSRGGDPPDRGSSRRTGIAKPKMGASTTKISQRQLF